MSEPRLHYHYTRDHLWLHLEDGLLTIGLTEPGLVQLGDLIYYDPLPCGQHLAAGEIFASVEGENGQRALFTPIPGELVEINQDANEAPDIIGEFNYTDGWLVRLKLDETPDLSDYLAAGDYDQYASS